MADLLVMLRLAKRLKNIARFDSTKKRSTKIRDIHSFFEFGGTADTVHFYR